MTCSNAVRKLHKNRTFWFAQCIEPRTNFQIIEILLLVLYICIYIQSIIFASGFYPPILISINKEQ